MNRILQAALTYSGQLGFSVIPVGKDKRPLIKWEAYQKQRPTEDEIKSWYEKWPEANVGIVTGMISKLAVIDLDEPDKARPVLEELIPDSMVFPISKTPSGGEHWYFYCDNPRIRNNTRAIPGADLRGEGGFVVAPPSVNVDGKGYSWLPDLKITKVDLPALPDAYVNYTNNKAFNKGGMGGCIKDPVAFVALSFDQGNRDKTLFHIANHLVRGGMPEAEIQQTLVRLASTCNPPFPADEVQTKILSVLKRQEHREINLTKEIEEYIEATDGDFSATDCYNVLQSATRATKGDNIIINRRSVKDILRRLCKEKGRIEKVGSRDGVYRRIEEVAEEINWWDASTQALNVRFPLGVEEHVGIYPKNIIVVAGEPNSGKTAFFLNLAVMNAREHVISYLSSEMGATELKTRISKSDIPLDQWKAIKFKERSGNFADVVDPDGFTIIDYLEITDEFYKIAAFIKQIYDKLNRGICVIGIQKNTGRDIGRGGELGLEKPRLYLALEPGRMKIVKAKAWAKEGLNPNGLQRKFKLIQGAIFVNTTPWHRAGEL